MSDFVNQMKEAVGHIKQAQSIFARGPLDYYLHRQVKLKGSFPYLRIRIQRLSS